MKGKHNGDSRESTCAVMKSNLRSTSSSWKSKCRGRKKRGPSREYTRALKQRVTHKMKSISLPLRIAFAANSNVKYVRFLLPPPPTLHFCSARVSAHSNRRRPSIIALSLSLLREIRPRGLFFRETSRKSIIWMAAVGPVFYHIYSNGLYEEFFRSRLQCF